MEVDNLQMINDKNSNINNYNVENHPVLNSVWILHNPKIR